MISGRQTLASIERSFHDEQMKLEAVQSRISDVSDQLVELQKSEAGHYRELARLRVDSIASGAVIASIDATERQVAALLRARESAAKELVQTIRLAEDHRQQLVQERAAQADVLEQAAEKADAAEAKTQARLDADSVYRAQRERAREAERTALHAADKATRSEQEQDEKSLSYRNDRLFMYLWQRRYGTPGYRANPVTRWLDGKVAKRIGYTDTSVNYARLQAIPERLREHANRVKQQAETEFELLRQRELEAREVDGIPALEAVQAQEQDKLDAIDTRLEALAADYQGLLQRRERLAAGEDEHYQQAVTYLASEFGREDLQELRRAALATPFPEDDVIISRLVDAEQKRQGLEAALSEVKLLAQQHQERLRELESLRMEFKRRHYDRPDSHFSDGAMVGMILGNFLNGMANRDSLWRVLEQQQRDRPRRSNPHFGSGGFGRGSPWRGGGRGGGGGGFGGGGFSTGGGF
ncbi:MAG: hypothetical protein WAN46_13435 [Gammaproteobacteria bacterium]|jgi:uncharacterized membrane protein YgcG